MKIVAIVARIMLGLIFLAFGLNGFLNFMHAPLPTGLAGTFIGALVASHFILFVAAVQVISGALLLDQEGRNWTADPVKIDGPLLRLRPSQRLSPGIYTVSWHSVGHEGHRLDGRIQFTVRP